jgi:Na+/glutamate symporter
MTILCDHYLWSYKTKILLARKRSLQHQQILKEQQQKKKKHTHTNKTTTKWKLADIFSFVVLYIFTIVPGKLSKSLYTVMNMFQIHIYLISLYIRIYHRLCQFYSSCMCHGKVINISKITNWTSTISPIKM